MANTAYQVTNFAYQGAGLFAYQGSVDSGVPLVARSVCIAQTSAACVPTATTACTPDASDTAQAEF